MQPGPGSERLRDVAVGPSRAAAAGAFGTHLTDAQVTSYDDLRTEVDLARVRTLALVGGAAAARVLTALAPEQLPARILVRLDADPNGRKELDRVIAANPDLPPVELVTGRAAGPKAATGQGATATTRPGLLAGRTRPLLAVAIVALAVAATVLVVIGRSSLGADGVLVALLVLVAVAQLALGLGLAALLRQSRRLQRELEERLTSQRQQIVRESNRTQAKVLKELERAQAQSLALATLVSRINAGVREHTPPS